MSISSTVNTINSSSSCASTTTTSPSSEPDSESPLDISAVSSLKNKRHKVDLVDGVFNLTNLDKKQQFELSLDITTDSSVAKLDSDIKIKREKICVTPVQDSDPQIRLIGGVDEKKIYINSGSNQGNAKTSSTSPITTTTTATKTQIITSTKTPTSNVTKLTSPPSSKTRADLAVNSLSSSTNYHHHHQKSRLVVSKTRPLLINNQTVANIASAISAPLLSVPMIKITDDKQTKSLNIQTSELKSFPIVSSQLIFSSFLNNQQNSLSPPTSQSNEKPSATPTPTIVTGTIVPLSLGQKSISSPSPSSSSSTTTATTTTATKAACNIATTMQQVIGHPRSHHHELGCRSLGLLHHQSGTSNAAAARLVDMGKKLLEATRHNQVEQVRQLVVNSGAPFTSDWLGTTALHLAAQNGCAEIAEILLKGGVNRDAKTKLERTALHLAAQCGHSTVVDLLINHGTNIEARDMLKMTPLHWAVERGHINVAERLLIAGADVTIKSKFQLTPMDIARRSDYYGMVELFKHWSGESRDSDEEILETFKQQVDNCSIGESHDMLDFDYHFALNDSALTPTTTLTERNNGQPPQPQPQPQPPQPTSMIHIGEPPIDLVGFEWNELNFEPDLFLSNDNDCNNEPKVEYLKKVVEELQKENRQLRQKVEQLSTQNQEV